MAHILRRQEVVIDGALDLLAEARLAGQAQEAPVELQPGHRHTHLADVRRLQRQQLPLGLEVFRGTQRPGAIQLVPNHVLPSAQHGIQQSLVCRQAIEINEAVEVGEHLIRLAVGDAVDAAGLEQCPHNSRAVRLVVGAHQVPAELEITDIRRKSVESAHRLEHRGRRHPQVLAGSDDVALSGCLAEGADQQITHAATRPKRRGLRGELVVTQEANQAVLLYPDVPARPAPRRRIGTEVTIGLLAGDERLRHPLGDAPQPLVFAVAQRVAGCVEKLSGVLPRPCGIEAARSIATQEARQAGVRVDPQQPLLHIDPHALGEDPTELVRPERQGSEDLGNLLRDGELRRARSIRRLDARSRRRCASRRQGHC